LTPPPGRPPFPSGDLLARKRRKAFDPLPNAVPESLSRLVAACFEPEGADRPRDMREVDATPKGAAG
jgi:hypothetical protein